jgi:hypothetical protein
MTGPLWMFSLPRSLKTHDLHYETIRASSVNKTMLLLVSVPMFLTPFLIAGMGFAWRR